MAILDFVFTQNGLFTTLYPNLCKKLQKKSSKLLFMKSQKITGDSVNNESAIGHKGIESSPQTLIF